MPAINSYDGTCVGGAANGFSVTDKNSYQQCIDGGGTYQAYKPDAGHERVSGLALDEQLGVDDGQAGPFSNHEIGKRLLLFPICEVHRRAHRSAFLSQLDILDRNFTQELQRLFDQDHDLRHKVSQFVLDISWVAARALSEQGSAATDVPVVSDELVDRGRQLGADIQSRSEDPHLKAAISEAIELGGKLRGVAVTDVVAVLAGRVGSAES